MIDPRRALQGVCRGFKNYGTIFRFLFFTDILRCGRVVPSKNSNTYLTGLSLVMRYSRENLSLYKIL